MRPPAGWAPALAARRDTKPSLRWQSPKGNLPVSQAFLSKPKPAVTRRVSAPKPPEERGSPLKTRRPWRPCRAAGGAAEEALFGARLTACRFRPGCVLKTLTSAGFSFYPPPPRGLPTEPGSGRGPGNPGASPARPEAAGTVAPGSPHRRPRGHSGRTGRAKPGEAAGVGLKDFIFLRLWKPPQLRPPRARRPGRRARRGRGAAGPHPRRPGAGIRGR